MRRTQKFKCGTGIITCEVTFHPVNFTTDPGFGEIRILASGAPFGSSRKALRVAQRESILIFLNPSVFDIPYLCRKTFEKVSVVDDSENGAFEIGERLFKARA